MALEQEVKLAFDSVEAARQAVHAAGGRLVASRRLLDDRLFDTADARLRRAKTTFRIRRDGDETILTFKGPPQPGVVKSREEIETSVGDAAIAERLLEALGLRQSFHSQKYREEFALDGTTIAIDDTPIGVFVEIEGNADRIPHVAAKLGRSPADYRLESYPRLYLNWCQAQGVTPGDMVFSDAS